MRASQEERQETNSDKEKCEVESRTMKTWVFMCTLAPRICSGNRLLQCQPMSEIIQVQLLSIYVCMYELMAPLHSNDIPKAPHIHLVTLRLCFFICDLSYCQISLHDLIRGQSPNVRHFGQDNGDCKLHCPMRSPMAILALISQENVMVQESPATLACFQTRLHNKRVI